jgi:2,3-bisphosphoglycerate-independent phosphoglycerate mutase
MPSLMVATLIQNLEKIHSGSRKLYQNTSVQLASIIGRYYAMDRDKRWERIKLAYDLLVNGQGTQRNAVATMEESYANNVTDEFIDPITIIDSNDKPMATIEEGVVIFFNFRTDREES